MLKLKKIMIKKDTTQRAFKRAGMGLCLYSLLSMSYAMDTAEIEKMIQQGQHQQALQALSSALQDNQHDLALQVLQADALAASGETEQAIERYRALIKQHPRQAELYNNLAILLSNQGDYQAARDVLNQGMKTSQTYAVIYDNLSNIYMEMARDSYGKALQLGVKLQPLPLKKLALQAAPSQPLLAQATSGTITPSSKPEIKPVISHAEKSTVVVAASAVSNSSKQEVIDSLQGWAAAWSAQATDLYLSFYHQQFAVPDGLGRGAWEAQRKQRLHSPGWIEVELDDMKVDMQQPDRATVTLVQAYRSNTYQDKTRKQIVMAHTSNGWRILQERSLGLVQ